MTRANATRLAWTLVAVAVALTAAATALPVADGTFTVGGDILIWAITFVFSGAGHVIATRVRHNAIGWMFLGVGVSAALSGLVAAYARHWIATGSGPRGLGQVAAVYGTISWVPFILVPATFLPLLFPDGHLLTSRWRPVAWVAGLGIGGVLVAGVLAPGPLEDYPRLDNPYGVEGAAIDALEGLSLLVVGLALFASAASLIVRFRRARGEERQQTKWIAFAGAVAAVAVVLMVLAYEDVGGDVADAVIMTSVLSLPVATAIAIVRYRLYDIDVVINRALVYGSLTATLAAVYVGSVLLLQVLLSALTQGSGLAVAASTLAVAALFRPVRGRIQGSVDRRFFRSRYDAARTVERSGAELRDEVDLESLSADLRAVVTETMRPVHISLWLRPPEADR